MAAVPARRLTASTWRSAEEVLEDPDRWDHAAFALWSWLGADGTRTPAVQVDDVGRREPGLAAFLATVLELSDRSAVLTALRREGAAGVYRLAGLTAVQARAHDLLLAGRSYGQIAATLGCSLGTVRTHLARADQKLRRLAA